MTRTTRLACLLLIATLIAACASPGGRRVSEPAASVQQLTVDAQGGWSLQLRLQNFSSVSMRFDRVDLAMTLAGAPAATLAAAPALDIAAESADVVTLRLTPSPEARLQVADALASGRSVNYRLDGQLTATPDKGKPREFDIRRDSALSPAPGLPGVLR